MRVVRVFLCLLCWMTPAAFAATADNTAAASANTLPLQQIQRFTNAIAEIKEYYVEPVPDEKLFKNAIRGMVAGLDPHSAYLDAKELKELQGNIQGEYAGVGLEVTLENDLLRVVTPLDGGPAKRAGIKSKDIIVRIDKTPIKGMSSLEAANRLRGKKGTKVVVTIIREDVPKPLKFYLTRQIIQTRSVRTQILADDYAYVRIGIFQTGTQAELKKAIDNLKREMKGKIKGVILDLRDNPGGSLDSAIESTNLFLDSKKLLYDRLIVYTKGRFTASQFQAKATSTDILNGLPIVVLINEGSASGAEIMAGALQDQKRAVILGTNSFGKGSVQTVLPLDNESAIKLTTAIYYTPAGRSIQAKGIQPDVVIAELKMPNPKKEKQPWIYLKESDLEGHLGNTGAPVEESKQEKQAETSPEEISQFGALPTPATDYQLHEALNLLKALSVLRR